MNIIKVIFVLFCLECVIGCQKKQTEYSNTKLELLVKADYPTQMSLYYAIDTADNFSEEHRINFQVKKIKQWQSAWFEFPTHIVPKKLMLRMGMDSLLTSIQIKDVVISSQNKEVYLENAELHLFFLPNKYIETKSPGYYKTFPINGRFAPYVQSTPFYQQRLKIEF